MSKQTDALERMAENERELGLDYMEPAQQRDMPKIGCVNHDCDKCKAQQQEPVVWMYVNKSTHETKFQKHMRDFVDHGLWAEVPLYGEPLANHELRCVCGAVWCGDEMVHLPDKRPPASKPWVGLTDEEVEDLYFDGFSMSELKQFASAIEAKLREKNA